MPETAPRRPEQPVPEVGGPAAEPRRGQVAKVPQVDAWRAVIGEKHSGYYLARFERLSRPGARRIGWHWPAFLAAGYWLLYRKMWGWAAVYLALPALLALVDGLLSRSSGHFQITIDPFALLLVAAYMVLSAMLANWLYLRHCNRLIRRTRRNLRRHEYLRRLSRRGGTSESAALAAVIFSGLAVTSVLVGLGLAVYDDYDKRQKVVAALKIGADARAAVSRFIDQNGTLPATLEAAAFSLPVLPAFVSRLTMDPRTGTIEIGVQVSRAEMGALYLVPAADDPQRLGWSCHVDPAIEPFSPPSCRGPD